MRKTIIHLIVPILLISSILFLLSIKYNNFAGYYRHLIDIKIKYQEITEEKEQHLVISSLFLEDSDCKNQQYLAYKRKLEEERKRKEAEEAARKAAAAERARKEAAAFAALNEETILQRKDKIGSAGRLYIPSVYFSVAMYYSSGDDGQQITDRSDSALYFRHKGRYGIADHNYQGFYKMKNAKIGSLAYIRKPNGAVEKYKLINKFSGHNTGTLLTDNNYTPISEYAGDLFMYTCNDNWHNITISLWQRI